MDSSRPVSRARAQQRDLLYATYLVLHTMTLWSLLVVSTCGLYLCSGLYLWSHLWSHGSMASSGAGAGASVSCAGTSGAP